MTKEELEKEADELYKDWYAHKLGAISITDVICKMAEPREKRIAELERKLEQTEKDLTDYQFNYPKIKYLEKEKCELLGIIQGKDTVIQDLQKENAELKKRVENQKSFLERIEAKFELGEIERKEIEGYLESEQLTEAKEIIDAFLDFESSCQERGIYISDEIREKANKFLEEKL